MKLNWTVATLATVIAAVVTVSDAARYTVRISSRSYRYSYRSYVYVYRGPVYSRRLSSSLMGPLYFSYVSRYPMHFSYRRTPIESADTMCVNHLALANGSYVGNFSCPFLPDEPSNWTRCCGYETEQFCCDPTYDDSWKNARLNAVIIVLIVLGCLFSIGVTVLLICCCCIRKHRANAASSEPQSKPFVDSGGKQVEGLAPAPPPYPTMEYGTIPVQPQAGGPPYPTPYPPPPYGNYGSQN